MPGRAILNFMVCSNPLIVYTRQIYTIVTLQERMISEDNFVNWRKYTENYLDFESTSCPIMLFGSDEIFSIWISYRSFYRRLRTITWKKCHDIFHVVACRLFILLFVLEDPILSREKIVGTTTIARSMSFYCQSDPKATLLRLGRFYERAMLGHVRTVTPKISLYKLIKVFAFHVLR